MGALDDLVERLAVLPPEEVARMEAAAYDDQKGMKWRPNPGPQTDAYLSDADVLLYGGEPGGGKLLKLNTLIPTPFGWTTMGEVAVGDMVISESGVPCRVVAKSEIEVEDTYCLTFSDGSEIIAGARHQWVTSTRAERMRELKCTDEWRKARREARPARVGGKKSVAFSAAIAKRNANSAKPKDLPLSSIRTTEEIFKSVMSGGGRINHSIAVAKPLELPNAELLIDPYVLGAWLGDGSSTSGQITGIDEEIFQQVANGGYAITRHANLQSRGILGLQVQIKQLGVYNNKHIPASYLRASIDQRLALLQGLMDTDGYCDKRGQCEIQLTRKALIDGAHELLSSLGIKAEMREGVAKLYGRVISKKWRLKFMTDLPAFRLPRKLIRQKRAGFRGTHNTRYITSVVPVDSEQMQCIQVDSPSHCYLVGKAMIPTHNSQLALGLAFNEHKRVLIMRRQYGDLDRLIEDALKIHGSRNGFNGSPPPKLKVSEDHIIDFAAAHRVGDEQSQMGKGRDLIVFDEATHFAESQVRFVMGWLRTDLPGQRCRVVMATNPPLDPEGLWVVKMFAPWLDPVFHNPAKHGELRWVISDADGNDQWVDGPGEYQVIVAGREKTVKATSRTYIPASVRDNPYYAATDYERQLDAMPEPWRSMLMGGFQTAFRDKPNQVIPTNWITAAQARWTEKPPVGVPQCAIGVDATGGGHDPMVLAIRHDGWFAPMIEIPAKEIPNERAGRMGGGIIVAHRRNQAQVVVDMGGGYGTSMYEHLRANEIPVSGYVGSSKSPRRTKDGLLGFFNHRSASIWKLRDALDPDQQDGSPIALPPDAELAADLAAWTLDMEYNGIKIESKENVCDRLGRSTNKGDAVVMAWSQGPTYLTDGPSWRDSFHASSEEMGTSRPRMQNKAVMGRGR